MSQYKMWIDGKWVEAESGKTYPVYNPATGEVIAQLPLGGVTDVDKAVVAARKAFPIWSKKSQADRSAIAMKIAAMLRDNARELGKLDTLDHGSPAQRAADDHRPICIRGRPGIAGLRPQPAGCNRAHCR